jgi:hypothetical protein
MSPASEATSRSDRSSSPEGSGAGAVRRGSAIGHEFDAAGVCTCGVKLADLEAIVAAGRDSICADWRQHQHELGLDDAAIAALIAEATGR